MLSIALFHMQEVLSPQDYKQLIHHCEQQITIFKKLYHCITKKFFETHNKAYYVYKIRKSKFLRHNEHVWHELQKLIAHHYDLYNDFVSDHAMKPNFSDKKYIMMSIVLLEMMQNHRCIRPSITQDEKFRKKLNFLNCDIDNFKCNDDDDFNEIYDNMKLLSYSKSNGLEKIVIKWGIYHDIKIEKLNGEIVAIDGRKIKYPDDIKKYIAERHCIENNDIVEELVYDFISFIKI